MRDEECIRFLQWALPRLGLRWSGYKKVRRQVCRRVRRRVGALGLEDLDGYRERLERRPDEWAELERLTHITISRFYRDRAVFDALREDVIPALAHGRTRLRAWSAGAAGGEEAYTLALMWNLELAARCAPARLEIIATDVDDTMLARARAARYDASSVDELPAAWRRDGFEASDGKLCLRAEHRALVTLARHDVRGEPPAAGLDLILCRYLAFTYYDEPSRTRVGEALAGALRPGGALVIGTHEAVPDAVPGLEPWPGHRCILRRGAA